MVALPGNTPRRRPFSGVSPDYVMTTGTRVCKSSERYGEVCMDRLCDFHLLVYFGSAVRATSESYQGKKKASRAQ